MAMAEAASSLKPEDTPRLVKALEDSDSAVRWWATLGILIRGASGLEKARKALTDASPYVRMVAAETPGRYGRPADTSKALAVVLELAPAGRNGAYVSLFALNALDELGSKAKPAKAAIATMKLVDDNAAERARINGSAIVKR
jgi:uncharacterized sulfatase